MQKDKDYITKEELYYFTFTHFDFLAVMLEKFQV